MRKEAKSAVGLSGLFLRQPKLAKNNLWEPSLSYSSYWSTDSAESVDEWNDDGDGDGDDREDGEKVDIEEVFRQAFEDSDSWGNALAGATGAVLANAVVYPLVM